MAQLTDPTLLNTDCTCTVCRQRFERSQSEQITQSGEIISNTEPLLSTLRPRPPLPPPSCNGPKCSLVCALWTLSPCLAAPLRSRDVPGEARSLDGRSPFPNRKYSPSESESANNICNTSSQFNFLLVIWRFSLTHYELNCSRINDTISHLFGYFLWRLLV